MLLSTHQFHTMTYQPSIMALQKPNKVNGAQPIQGFQVLPSEFGVAQNGSTKNIHKTRNNHDMASRQDKVKN